MIYKIYKKEETDSNDMPLVKSRQAAYLTNRFFLFYIQDVVVSSDTQSISLKYLS